MKARFRIFLVLLLTAFPACLEETGISPAGHLGGESSAEPVMGVRELVALHCVPETGTYKVIATQGTCAYDQFVYAEAAAPTTYYLASDLEALQPGSSVNGRLLSVQGQTTLGGKKLFTFAGQRFPFESAATAGAALAAFPNLTGYAMLDCEDPANGASVFAYASSDGSYYVVLRGPQGQTFDFEQASFSENGTQWIFSVGAAPSHSSFQIYSDSATGTCGVQGAFTISGKAYFTPN